MSARTPAKNIIRGNPAYRDILKALSESAEPVTIADIRAKTGLPPDHAAKILTALRHMETAGLIGKKRITDKILHHNIRRWTYYLNSSAKTLIKELGDDTE